jgi:hypothetical protein
VTGVLLERRPRRWGCPNCLQSTVTFRADVHTPFHTCPGTGMLSIPYVEEGIRAKVSSWTREDYVGREDVTLDGNGLPIMAVTTTRDDGEDRTVYAPCAQLERD